MVLLLTVAMVTALLDQWSKREVLLRLGPRTLACTSYLEIRCIKNLKRRYGQSSTKKLLVGLWVASAVSAITLQAFGPWFHSTASIIGLGLAFGGAAGNLCDIVRRDCVIDFLDLGWWPVFNVADVAIPLGLLLAFWF